MAQQIPIQDVLEIISDGKALMQAILHVRTGKPVTLPDGRQEIWNGVTIEQHTQIGAATTLDRQAVLDLFQSGLIRPHSGGALIHPEISKFCMEHEMSLRDLDVDADFFARTPVQAAQVSAGGAAAGADLLAEFRALLPAHLQPKSEGRD